MTISDEGRHAARRARPERAGWRRARGAAFAALVVGGLMLAPAAASAADAGAPSGPQAGSPKARVSPYARFARERQQQQLVGKKSARGRPGAVSVGHATHAGSRTRR
jgi:hypothetical protein